MKTNRGTHLHILTDSCQISKMGSFASSKMKNIAVSGSI